MMDMGSNPMFRPYNQTLAKCYWYIIAALVGFILLLRAVEHLEIRSRLVCLFLRFKCQFLKEPVLL